MTAIEWTGVTWNPVLGCSMAPGSETGGCLNCYAARMAMRNLWPGPAYARMTRSGPRWTGKVELRPERLDAPLHWRNPRRVFVNSMSDLFHEALPYSEIAKVFDVMMMPGARRHTFQVLTKRPRRMLGFVRDWWLGSGSDLPPNVWLGVSVEDQATADERIPLLLQTPAAKRFVSYEPALGPVDLRAYLATPVFCLDWVIVGGESGPGARPCDVAWIRSVVSQCRAAGAASFVKQLGARPIIKATEWNQHAGRLWKKAGLRGDGSYFPLLESPKGGDPSEWPEDLRVREFPR